MKRQVVAAVAVITVIPALTQMGLPIGVAKLSRSAELTELLLLTNKIMVSNDVLIFLSMEHLRPIVLFPTLKTIAMYDGGVITERTPFLFFLFVLSTSKVTLSVR